MKKLMLLLLTVAFVSTQTSVYGATDELTVEQKYAALVQARIFYGYGDGEAHLERNITRAELAVVMSRVLGLDTESNPEEQSEFVDLKNHWVSKTSAIQNMESHKIMVGKGNYQFDPNGLVTIEEIAAVLTRALSLETVESQLTDSKASTWAHKYISTAVSAGLIDPQSDYTVHATRAFLVDVIYI